jgi:hypothetical protein
VSKNRFLVQIECYLNSASHKEKMAGGVSYIYDLDNLPLSVKGICFLNAICNINHLTHRPVDRQLAIFKPVFQTFSQKPTTLLTNYGNVVDLWTKP